MKYINMVKNEGDLLYADKGLYSFVNMYNISFLFEEKYEGIKFGSDGWLLCFFLRVLYGLEVDRLSFDNTSIAPEFFRKMVVEDKSVYVVGGDDSECKIFVTKIEESNKGLNICGYRNGYFDQDSEVALDILHSNPDVIIIGLGAPKQEKFLNALIKAGYAGLAITCGGYISQEASSNKKEAYYPYLFNKFNLRFLYRFINEPHTRRRYLKDYPKNLVKLLVLKIQRKVWFYSE